MVDDRLYGDVEPMGEVDCLAAGEGAIIGAVVQIAGERENAPKKHFEVIVPRHAHRRLAVHEVGRET